MYVQPPGDSQLCHVEMFEFIRALTRLKNIRHVCQRHFFKDLFITSFLV